jgi:hypothetical protein
MATKTRESEKYNGWTNRQTWNVGLWIGNDEGLYHLAREYRRSKQPYQDFREALTEIGGAIAYQTPDGVAWNDSALDTDELDDMIREL